MISASNHNKTLSQADIDRMILDFAIDGLLPFRFVSLSSFNRIIRAISPKYNVISESTLKRRYGDLATTISQNIKSMLNEVSYVATTTDGWSIRGRSFVGVTAHCLIHILSNGSGLHCHVNVSRTRIPTMFLLELLAQSISNLEFPKGLSPLQLTMPQTL